MKKSLILALAVIITLTSSCARNSVPADGTETQTPEAPVSETVTSQTETETAPKQTTAAKTTTAAPETEAASETETEPEPEAEPDVFPRLDGSTSTIPLETGIRAAFLGISQEEAEEQVIRNKTHQAFENLLNGECDGLLSVPLSEEQEQARIDAGVELEKIALAWEGFVFIVNIDNPVDTLTSEQIRQIYSGEITNWKELGGNDAPIKAYQRNNDSGSQNFMIDFMGGVSLMSAPTDYIAEAMGTMVDIVANYENGIDAIGYSVYTYAADMYSADNGIKFIKVDGVAPGRENFKNGSYTATGYTYLMFNKNQPAGSLIRGLADYLKTPEGISVIENSGYATVGDIPHLGLPDMPLNLLSDGLLGSGPEKSEDYSFPLVEYGVALENNPRLKDKGVEKLITDDFKKFYPEINEDKLWSGIKVKNGYMTVEDLTYDLYTGKRLKLTDFFFKGEAFVPSLNQSFKKGLLSEFYRGDGGGMFANAEPDFWGVDGGATITLNGVILSEDSYYSMHAGYTPYYKVTAFSEKPFINMSFCHSVFAPSVPRDMKGIWEDDGVATKKAIIYEADNFSIENEILYSQFDEDCPLSGDVIKKANDYIMSLTIPENLEKFSAEYNIYGAWGDTVRAYYLCGYYICVHTERGSGPSANRYFDAKTFEPLRLDGFLSPEWRTTAEITDLGSGRVVELPEDYADYEIVDINGLEDHDYGYDENLRISFKKYGDSHFYSTTIPKKILR